MSNDTNSKLNVLINEMGNCTFPKVKHTGTYLDGKVVMECVFWGNIYKIVAKSQREGRNIILQQIYDELTKPQKKEYDSNLFNFKESSHQNKSSTYKNWNDTESEEEIKNFDTESDSEEEEEVNPRSYRNKVSKEIETNRELITKIQKELNELNSKMNSLQNNHIALNEKIDKFIKKFNKKIIS